MPFRPRKNSIPGLFEGIIGTSEALKRVLAHWKTVASTDFDRCCSR